MELRVYYEDTDAGGVVYHANYVRYMARGRTEFLRERGLSQDLYARGYAFPVVRLKIDFLSPAFHDDLLRVDTQVLEIGKTSLTFGQLIMRPADGKLLTDGEVTVVCSGLDGKLKRLPPELLKALQTR